MKPSVTIPITKQKKWSKRLKLFGAALLLSAFGMQTQQNSQSALSLERMQAAELQSRTKQKAIGYETLYFSAKATGLDEPQYLKFAAQQYFYGSMAMMVTGPGDKVEIGRRVGQLQRAAEAVSDLDSFRRFINVANERATEEQTVELAGLVEPAKNATALGRLYLILYVIGSIGALIGQALD